jgi:hypothetical protein
MPDTRRDLHDPILRQLIIEIFLPSDFGGLQDVDLILDDTSVNVGDDSGSVDRPTCTLLDGWTRGCPVRFLNADTRVPLVLYGHPRDGIQFREYERWRWTPTRVFNITLDFPLWRIGDNRLQIIARAEHGTVQRDFSFGLVPPDPAWGVSREGNTVSFRIPGLRMFIDTPSDEVPACGYFFCLDADEDGLWDLWENIAAHVLNPVLELDEHENWLTRRDPVAMFTRVVPALSDTDGSEQIQLLHNVAWARDYGPGGHNGDTSTIQQVWQVVDLETITLVSVWTRGHSTSIRDGIRQNHDHAYNMNSRTASERPTLLDDGRPLVYIEEDKHGTWGRDSDCPRYYDCKFDATPIEAGRLWLPPIQVGEPPETGRPLVDSMDAYPALRGKFPGEAVWSDSDGKFCGGHTCSGDSPGDVGEGLSDAKLRHAQRRPVH